MTGRAATAQPEMAIFAACVGVPNLEEGDIDTRAIGPGNSLLPGRISKSLTSISPILDPQELPAGVHVDRNLCGQRICAHFPKFWVLVLWGKRET